MFHSHTELCPPGPLLRRAVVATIVLGHIAAGCGLDGQEEALGGDASGQEDAFGSDADGGEDSGTPQASEELRLDASSDNDWVFLDLSAGGLVSISEPSRSTDWDLAFQRSMIQTNGGTSGPGVGGALETGELDFAAVTSVPETGYAADEMLPVPGPPGAGEFSGNPVLNQWYDYEPATRAVSSKGLVYAIQTADGGYGKLRIDSYISGQYVIQWAYQDDGSSSF